MHYSSRGPSSAVGNFIEFNQKTVNEVWRNYILNRMLKYPGRSSSEKLLSPTGTKKLFLELGQNLALAERLTTRIGRETESTAYQAAKVDTGGIKTLMLPNEQTHYRPKGKGT